MKDYTAEMVEARDELLREAYDALERAHGLLTEHHSVSVMSKFQAGSQCPVCVEADGKAPELDRICKTKKKLALMLTYSGQLR